MKYLVGALLLWVGYLWGRCAEKKNMDAFNTLKTTAMGAFVIPTGGIISVQTDEAIQGDLARVRASAQAEMQKL